MGLEGLLAEHKLTEGELKRILKDLSVGKPLKRGIIQIPFDMPRIRFTAISDTHMGHKEYRPDI